MGGWRCSYRNCTVRTDGKTHMFHYPVFDKVRCHHWLVNAGRLDFLNLRVSQLKNRVICQHHFPDEHFMNFKKDKLKYDAVPSLNGPFCDVSEVESKSHEETSNSLSIMFDDIENEYMTLNDKKANYSVKYADFLTSSELADIDISTFMPQNNVFNRNKYCENEQPILNNNDSKAYQNPEIFESKENTLNCDAPVRSMKPNLATDMVNYMVKGSTPNLNKKFQTQPVLVVPPYIAKFNQNQKQPEENILEIELPPGFINNNTLLTDSKLNILEHSGSVDEKAVPVTPNPPKKEPKVRILSEKRISIPLTVTGNLELVSPSTVLPILQKKPPTLMPREVSNEIFSNNQELLLDVKPITDANKKPFEMLDSKPPDHIIKEAFKKKDIKDRKVNQDNNVKSPRLSLLKNKITPERIAAIEEKRKFNMKLRDTIETFLDKLDEQDKEIRDSRVSKHIKDKVKTPSVQDRTIASLEARIKKMEDTLLNKIDENSKSILELRNTIVQKNQKQKSNSTQTYHDENSQKKRLYQEISQYLSPNANSLIYEELFINMYGKNVSKVPSPKRKRRR